MDFFIDFHTIWNRDQMALPAIRHDTCPDHHWLRSLQPEDDTHRDVLVILGQDPVIWSIRGACPPPWPSSSYFLQPFSQICFTASVISQFSVYHSSDSPSPPVRLDGVVNCFVRDSGVLNCSENGPIAQARVMKGTVSGKLSMTPNNCLLRAFVFTNILALSGLSVSILAGNVKQQSYGLLSYSSRTFPPP